MSQTPIPDVTAASGLRLPAVGFGTYKLNGVAGVEAIDSALDVGYRLLDSAFNYENEGAVGAAVLDSTVPREEIIVTSKLPGRHHEHDQALTTIEESVFRSGLDFIDLYLIHWPNPKVGKYVEAWEALLEARERGLIKHVGVCNFLPEHLDTLSERTGVLPEVNQIELHPYFPQAEQRAYDAEHGIITEAWSPLGRASDVLQDPALQALAEKYGVDVGRLILRWETQLGVVPLPKSATPERQVSNLQLFDFEIAPDDLAEIEALGRPDGRLADQDPAVYEEF